jgi:uncharacterized damage-inducible protein DinB
MPISEMLLPEFDREAAVTRTFLAQAPEENFAWQPHPKSFTLGQLANHLAMLPQYATITMTTPSFNVAGAPSESSVPETRQALLELFDANIAAARAAIAAATDEAFGQLWTLQNGEQTVFTMPRLAVLRVMVLSHLVHHRAQLGVYFRQNDLPVPASYGPSADEGM